MQCPPLKNFLKYLPFRPNVSSQHLKGYSLCTNTISRKQRNHLLCLVNVAAKHVTIMSLSAATIYFLHFTTAQQIPAPTLRGPVETCKNEQRNIQRGQRPLTNSSELRRRNARQMENMTAETSSTAECTWQRSVWKRKAHHRYVVRSQEEAGIRALSKQKAHVSSCRPSSRESYDPLLLLFLHFLKRRQNGFPDIRNDTVYGADPAILLPGRTPLPHLAFHSFSPTLQENSSYVTKQTFLKRYGS